jgi:hypothetical protein
MYALFPLLLSALGCGLLGAWLVHDARFRRVPTLAWPGWCLIAILPLVLLGLLAEGLLPGARGLRGWLFGASALLLLLALGTSGIAMFQIRRHPSRLPFPGLLGPTLLVPAIGVITLCFALSILLAISNDTLGF